MVIGFFNFKNSSQREPSKTKCGPHFNSYARCACAKSLSPVQCPSLGAEQPQPARHGARASQARVLRLLSRERERSGALARAPLESRMCWRPRLARRRVLNRREQASRWCIVFSSSADRPQSARYGARASQARVVRLLPRESERSGALACAPRKSWLCVGGHYWQVAPRSCTEGESPLAGTVPFHRVRANYHKRGAARARRKLAFCASSPETASAVVCSCARRARAGCVLEASAGHVAARSCTEEERRLADAVRFHRVQIDYNQRDTTFMRRKLACCASSRERERAQWHARVYATQKKVLCLCVGGRCWLAGRYKVLNRRREPSRWHSALS